MQTKIIALEDLYNNGKCFSKGQIYTVNKPIKTEAALMEAKTTNDQGENHIIGSWWRNFEIVTK